MKSIIILLLIISSNIIAQTSDFSTSLTNNSNCGGTIVTFTISDTTDISTYKWEFGNGQPDVIGVIGGGNDGTSSTSYVAAGNYTVQLTVNDTIYTVQQINIYALPKPGFDVVNGTEESCINATATVDFKYLDSIPSFGASITSWSWNFGDGTGQHQQTGGGDVSYIYSKYGDYTVILDVTDLNGCTANTFKVGAVKLHSTPKADFKIDYPTDCSMPISVNFTDKSVDDQSSIVTWEWLFKDIATGTVVGTSTNQSPVFQFVNNGDYYATLKITTDGGCVDEMTQTINFDANTVSFTPINKQDICAGHSVSFINTSIDGSGGVPIGFHWDFGDGGNSTDENPTHIYVSELGSPYTVTLQVTFSNGCIGTYSSVDLINVTTVSGLSVVVDKDVSCKDFVVTATGSTGGVDYQWDFDYDGVTPKFDQSGINNVVTHNYTSEGIYHIFLRSVNSNGCFAETVYDSINIEYPKAYFDITSGANGCFLVGANFDASSSINRYPIGHNTIINYEWDFQNDTIIDKSGASPIVSHTYTHEGYFDTKLIITTEDNCTDTIIRNQVIERGLPPIADFTLTQTDLCVNTPVHFVNLSHSNPLYPTAPIDSVIWEFGDGTVLAGNPLITPSLNNPTHIYIDDTQDDGVPFEVVLTVFNYGCNSSIHTEHIDIDYPIARFTPSQLADCHGGGQQITFDALNGVHLSEGVDEYRWEFADGKMYPGPTVNDYAIGNDPTIDHVFTSLGHYDVKLFVKNSTSVCKDHASHLIVVETGTVDFEANDTVICRGDDVKFKNKSVASEPGIIYSWNFGADAHPATYTGAKPPLVHYTGNGEKTIKLVSSDPHTACGNTKIKIAYISVRGPKADFDWSSQNIDNSVSCLVPNQNVEFVSTTNSNTNLNTNISFKWDFGSSSSPNTATRTSEAPINIVYNDFGEKTVWLEVTDSRGCVDKIQKDNIITVPKLVADFNINAPIYCAGYEVDFADLSKYLNHYDIISWDWDFGQDAIPATSTSHNPVGIKYSSKGVKTVNLTITNNKGCTDTFIKDFKMYEANVSFTNITDVGCAPADVLFKSTSEDISKWQWEFGDPLSSPKSTENPSNIYIYPGKYDVTLITKSKGGCMDTLSKSTDVFVDGSYFDSLTYVVDQPCLHSPSNPKVTYTIHGLTDTKYVIFDFGDGSPAYNYTVPDILNPPSILDIVHIFDGIGLFTPKLTLQDDPSSPGSCGQFIYTPKVSPVVISKKPDAIFSDNSALGEVCSGSKVRFIDKSINNDLNHLINKWAWEFGNVGGSTSSNQNPTFRYSDIDIGDVDVKLTVENALGCTDNYTKTLTVEPGLDDQTIETHDTICAGTTIMFNADAATGGDGTYIYRWKKSSDAISWYNADGVNDKEDYTPPATNPSSPEVIYYKRRVSSATCHLYTPVFTVTTYPTPIGGNIIPHDLTVCYGDNHNTLSLVGSVMKVVEWQKDTLADFSTYLPISNITTIQDFTDLTKTTYYRVIVKSGVCPTVISDTATVTVLPKIEGNEIYPDDTLVCALEDAGIILPSAPTGGSGSFAFQWKESIDSITFGDISGAVNTSYAPGGLMRTRFYQRKVVSNSNCSVLSNIYKVDVIPQPDTTLRVSNPFVCEEDYATTPNTNIVVSNSEINVKYQAFLITGGSPQSSEFIGTGGNLNISVVTPITSTSYYIKATPLHINGAGSQCPVVLHNTAKITIVPIPNDALSVSDPNICEGQDASITINASEKNVKYYLKLSGVVKASTQGNGHDINFTVSPGPTSTTIYEVWAVSTLNMQLCAQVKLVDPSVITVLELPDNTLTVSDPMVCGEDISYDIIIDNTADTVDYTLISQNGIVISTKTGTGADLVFTLPIPPTDNTFEVWAKAHDISDFGVCDSVKLSDVANVTFAPIPNTSLVVNGDKVCEGYNAEVTVKASEQNVEYLLVSTGDKAIGNGGDVTFVVAPSVTTIYSITAGSTVIPSCADVALTNKATIDVIPTPLNLTITTNPSPANVCSNNSIDIIVHSTESSVRYILKKDGIITGDEFVGDGANKTFTVLTVADATYSVWAMPTDVDGNGNVCVNIQMGGDIFVEVDGPITIDMQPVDAMVCSGSVAFFGVTSSNASGDAIIYQWQEDSGSGFVDMAGETSNTLSVSSPNANTYRVIVGSVYCSSVISNSVIVNSVANPVVDHIDITIDDVCLGNDISVAYQSNLSTNEYYRIYYNVTGNNIIKDTSIVTLLTNGSGVFTITADSFPNTGANALIVTEIDYAYGQGCVSSGLAITELFSIEGLPDTTSFGLLGDDICLGNNELIDVSGTLSDNIYNITYSLLGTNTVVSSVGDLSIQSGSGVFTVPSTELIDTGATQFVLTDIANSWGLKCPVTGLSYKSSFVVEPNPDVNNLLVAIPNICSGSDAIVHISGDLIDGIYSINYNLEGVNISSNTVIVALSRGDGTADFLIPKSQLINSGLTLFNITDISFTLGKACVVSGLSVHSSFEVEQKPDSKGIDIYAPDICKGDDATIYFSSNLANGNYLIHYKIVGDVPTYENDMIINLSTNDGNSTFIIGESHLPVDGFNTVSLVSISNTFGNNCLVDLQVGTPLTIEPLPDTVMLRMYVDTVCPSYDARVYIEGNLIDGQYLFTYNLSGSNIANGIPVYLNFINGNGTAQFSIPGTELVNNGMTDITFKTINFITGQQCGVSNINIDTNFMVEPIPDVNNLAISTDNICVGNTASVNVVSLLADGDYIITYNVENANYHVGIVDTIVITSGNAYFIVGQNHLSNSGTTTVVITDIKAKDGQQCNGAIVTAVTTSFKVEPLPYIKGASFIALDACQGDDVPIYGTSNLIDGSYIVYYHLTGVNAHSNDSLIIDITTGDGNFITYIPTSYVPSFGASTIWIDGVRFNSGKSCFVADNYQSNFSIAKVPDVNNLVANADSVCLGNYVTVDLTSNFDDGAYVFEMDITGANPNANLELSCDFVNGKGQLIIPSNYILNVGSSIITINEVNNKNGAHCASRVYNTITKFEIYDIPNVDTLEIDIQDVCLTYDAIVNIFGTLFDGEYTVEYDLTGANNSVGKIGVVTISRGIGKFNIPTNLLVNTGATGCVVRNISFTTGLSCDADLNISESFIVIPDPGSTNLMISADGICINTNAKINFTSVLPQGDYLFTYNLSVINDTIGLNSMGVINDGSGDGFFIVPDSLLTKGGEQTITVTGIDVLGALCSSIGLNIVTNFDIEGGLDIVSQYFDSAKCVGSDVSYKIEAINNGGGDVYFQWYSIDNGSIVYLNNQGVYNGAFSNHLLIDDNTTLDSSWYQCMIYTSHCSRVFSDSVMLEILSASACGKGINNLPNAYSPNGDGINDIWNIEGIQFYENNHVQVFNHLGGLVYETSGYDNVENRFDGYGNQGNFDNKEIRDGTYFYIIDLGDGSDLLKGYLVINR